ncbi:radical SAM protein [Candidatus Bathyarchaeota archaeon]|nr:radical SAM protein [Candidatus Bathyarchaeota archaeon]
MKVEKVVAFAGNKKYAIAYQDGTVECAYIFLAYRKDFQHIFCISSQIGCPFKCVFCSNSRGRFVRNLTENEIRDQIEILIEHLPILSANRVEIDFMGVGEPLLNLENILPILNSYRSQEDICFGVSTILPKAYFKELLALNYNPRTRLQISVHSALSEKREKLIGISSDFGQLLKAARDFYTKFPFRCVALNICLADGLNDT